MSEIPQKLTVEETISDPGLRALAERLVITVDGQTIESVTRYDVPAGEVERYAKHPDGRHKISGGELVRETLRGAVRISLK